MSKQINIVVPTPSEVMEDLKVIKGAWAKRRAERKAAKQKEIDEKIETRIKHQVAEEQAKYNHQSS